ncbi:MAG: hypothetical protein NTZ54_16120 [Alphaproteobacteria bacterium]|uniref:hypothetical protein n=1 Tax=Aestuariivirga sp. TaxID=2650926 RepID=UPI0030177B2A|nr:hypothetical protein [Alphaproteobacteria bacterium]
MPDKLADTVTYVLSLSLAAGVIAFAAYKVNVLNSMENPPVNLGLNFPPPKRKVIMEGPQGGDLLTTQSLGPARAGGTLRDGGGNFQSYVLLTVIDGVAFVAVDTDTERTLMPVTIGSRLAGGPMVSAIRRHDGRWWLTAGNLTLEQREPIAQ